ncbi:unnamed protein product [Ectocarpus sp. 13 AM-2016]
MGLVAGGASMGGDNGGDASMGQAAAAAAAAGLDALYAEDVDMGEAMPWSFAPDSSGFAVGAASNALSAQDLSAPAAAAGATPATAEPNDASSNTGASASSQSSATAPAWGMDSPSLFSPEKWTA